MNTLATQEQIERLEARELEALNRKVDRRNQQRKDEALRLFQKRSECSVRQHWTVTQTAATIGTSAVRDAAQPMGDGGTGIGNGARYHGRSASERLRNPRGSRDYGRTVGSE